MRDSRAPVASFRLYPERRSLYYKVNVWPTKAAMHHHVSWVKLGKGCIGLCSPETHCKVIKGKIRYLPCIGQINLIQGHIDAEVASHEIAHAVLAWSQRRRIDPFKEGAGPFCSDENERFAGSMGRMVAQFNHHAHRLSVWDHSKRSA